MKFGKPHNNNDSLSRKRDIYLIGLEDFENEVLKEKIPVLVLCMHQDPEFYSQIEIVDRIKDEIYGGGLKICLLEEESLGVFKTKYNVGGTPTFLVFSNGKEIARMLGQIEPAILKEFLFETLIPEKVKD